MLFFSFTSFIPNTSFVYIHKSPRHFHTLLHQQPTPSTMLLTSPEFSSLHQFCTLSLHSPRTILFSRIACTSPPPLCRFALLTLLPLFPLSLSSLPILHLLLPPKPEKPVFGTFSSIVVVVVSTNFFTVSP